MDNIPSLLIEYGLAEDEYWAKQFIKHGLITVNGAVISEEDMDLPLGAEVSKIGFIMRVGKRRWVKIINSDAG